MNADNLTDILLLLDIQSLYNMANVSKPMESLFTREFWVKKFSIDQLNDPKLLVNVLPNTTLEWRTLYLANQKAIQLMDLFPKEHKQINLLNTQANEYIASLLSQTPHDNSKLSFRDAGMNYTGHGNNIIYDGVIKRPIILILTRLFMLDPSLNVVDSDRVSYLHDFLIADRMYFSQYPNLRRRIDERIKRYENYDKY